MNPRYYSKQEFDMVMSNFRTLRKGLMISARLALDLAREKAGWDVDVLEVYKEERWHYMRLCGNDAGSIAYTQII